MAKAAICACAVVLALLPATAGLARAQAPTTPAQLTPAPMQTPMLPASSTDAETENLVEALIRLPLAALLGAALALRPKRRGTPLRTTAVVQTQILLSVVGAVIMLVVGASLARAFGIVGAANLIRYRSKIEDPKDAVVMLCTLAVGLASGVGLYRLAVFSTIFLVAALWVIESFEPKAVKHFMLSVKKGDQSEELRQKVESVFRRYRLKWELRTLADDEIAYDVQVPADMKTEPISDTISKLDPDGKIAIGWDEQKKKGS